MPKAQKTYANSFARAYRNQWNRMIKRERKNKNKNQTNRAWCLNTKQIFYNILSTFSWLLFSSANVKCCFCFWLFLLLLLLLNIITLCTYIFSIRISIVLVLFAAFFKQIIYYRYSVHFTGLTSKINIKCAQWKWNLYMKLNNKRAKMHLIFFLFIKYTHHSYI